MKVISIEIVNVGIIENTGIALDKPLLLFFGDLCQGKSTILKSVKWLLGAPWPEDIIRHGEKEATITMTLDVGIIGKSWYRSKGGTGETKSRDITFIRDGRPVPKPASEIARLLNPFLLDQDHLVTMNEPERRRYFSELFAVDTAALDRDIFKLDNEATQLRLEIKSFGDIDLTPVPDTNLPALRERLAKLRSDWGLGTNALREKLKALEDARRTETDQIDRDNATARTQNSHHDEIQRSIKSVLVEINDLETKLADARSRLEGAHKALQACPLLVLKPYPEGSKEIVDIDLALNSRPLYPDTAAIDAEIAEAQRNEVRREQLEKNRKRARDKEVKEAQLSGITAKLKKAREEKVAKLAEINQNAKIPGLKFDETGSFTYEDTAAGMLSSSQLMRLSSALSSMYPPGFGIELIDRAESLGKSIFEFVAKAKRDNSTILAAIVGEEPASVPENVGVFVVASGKVSRKEKPAQESLI